MIELSSWENFYVIVGSSAGALIGLQFVVITLIGENPALRMAEAGAAFATPSVVHFGAVLLLAALVSAPWESAAAIATLWVCVGSGGLVYSSIVTRRLLKQTTYRPVFEDWLFHAVLPLASYAALTLSAVTAFWHTREALFGIGAAALSLLFAGIHNAWDAVTYHIFTRKGTRHERRDQAG